jgi:ketosteroid isomerase-like protein
MHIVGSDRMEGHHLNRVDLDLRGADRISTRNLHLRALPQSERDRDLSRGHIVTEIPTELHNPTLELSAFTAARDDRAMTIDPNEAAIRAAYDAYTEGDIEGLLAFFSPDLEWTYLDPSVEKPAPQVCRGLVELRRALRRQADQGLKAQIEQVQVNGSEVVAVIHIPGVDQLRARKSNDRNYDVFSFSDGRIVALRACVDLTQALQVAGLA